MEVVWLAFAPIWILITWVAISSIALLYTFTGRDSHSVKCLYLNPYFWKLFHWFIINSGICLQKIRHLTDFQSVDGSARWQTSFNFNNTLHAGILITKYWSLLTHGAVDALLALCSRGGNILFVVKKPHRLCCHQKLTNKIKPAILGVDNRLVELEGSDKLGCYAGLHLA